MKFFYSLLFVALPAISYCQTYTDLGDSGSTSLSYQSPIQKYISDFDEKEKFNDNMLDIFFARKVGKAFTGTNDLFLQKFFANFNTTEESVSVGFNFDDRWGNPLRQLDWVYTGGFKLQGSKTSSIFYKSSNEGDSFKGNNIGAFFKVSFIGNGTLNYKSSEKKQRSLAIDKYRELIYPKYEKKVQTYNNFEYANIKEYNQSLSKFDQEITSIKDQLKKKHREIYQEIAEDEIKYIQENNMYRFIYDWWASGDLYLPFGDKEYLVTPIVNNEPTSRKLYNFEMNFSLNGFIEWSAGVSLFGKLNYRAGGTNNILLDELTKKTFQTGIIDENNNVIISRPIQAYEADYNYFIRQSIKPELIFFVELGDFGSLGFSPAIEYNFGSPYKATNWKLGIPFSLKDKEGKPSVNFEVQWQERSGFSATHHYVGITTSFLFGSLL